MEIDKYQEAAQRTAIYPGAGTLGGLLYVSLGLGEVGEFQGKVKKIVRDDGGTLTAKRQAELIDELGDILWYVALAAGELGSRLDLVAALNLEKLKSRQERGKLGGSGDTR